MQNAQYKFLLFLALTLVFFPSQAICSPIAKVTVRAIDEEGSPIVGGSVHMSFSIPKKGDIGLDGLLQSGATDNEGKFTASSECYPYMGFSVDKEGYYQSGDRLEFKETSGVFIKKWKPWNPTIVVVLKKKRNPVPMYDNHRTTYKIPKFDTPIGFDLEKEDWVAPYGRGVVSDFIFSLSSEIRAYSDYDCSFTLTFSNPNDGIQEYYFDENGQSLYRWPFLASVDGYQNKLSKEKTATFPGKGYHSNEKEHVHYLFRVRTKVDNNGKIQEAMYGKMRGEFGFVPKGELTFRYFLNPDGTPNIEEDPKKNLFPEKMP